MRASFSLEAMLSMLFTVLTIGTLFYAFQLSAYSLEFQLSVLERERLALRVASHLLKSCQGEMGLAKCDGQYLYSHVLSQDAMRRLQLQEVRERFNLWEETGMGMFVRNLHGTEYLHLSDLQDERLCVHRLALLEGESGEELVLEVCVS